MPEVKMKEKYSGNVVCTKCGATYDKSPPQCRHPESRNSKTHIQNYWDENGVYHAGRNIRLCPSCTTDFERWIEGAKE